MHMSDAGRTRLTERSEGLVLSVYPDPATGGEPWTGGYGHTGPDVVPGMTVTQEMADAWLEADLAEAESAVNALVHVPLTQHQFDALTDFAFNEGAHNLATSTLLRLVNTGNFIAAEDEFGKWVLAHGQRMAGLVARRAAEADWFNDADTTPTLQERT